jgi:serine-type D-Ala-D-Ala carboxypeptidase (penicillin-binding protein 5/6)
MPATSRNPRFRRHVFDLLGSRRVADLPSLSRRATLGLALAAALTDIPAAAAADGGPGSGTIGGERLGRSGTQVAADAPQLPATNSLAWIVADRDSGAVLAAHDAHRRLPPASTLKMLFADTVLPKFDKALRHKVARSDLAGVDPGSSLVGVEAGTTYTVHDLWLGVFLRSGNDAVHVLAAMNGGVDRTIREMRARAVRLRALDTHVVSPDGYDHPGQVSSAYDLTLFARAGLRNADFREYCSTRTAEFPGEHGSGFQLQNTNRLLGEYRGMTGVKNGYTTNAGNTFTGAAKRDGRTLLVTVMHPSYGYDEVYREAALLLDWGFKAAASGAAPVGVLAEPVSAAAHASPGPWAGSPAAAPSRHNTSAALPSGPSVQAGTAAALSALIAGCALAARRVPRPRRRGRGRRRRS